MMKRIKLYIFLLAGLVLTGGCRQSSDVVSSSLLSKRKYRAGWHSDLFGSREAMPKEKSVAPDGDKSPAGGHNVSHHPSDSIVDLAAGPALEMVLSSKVASDVTVARVKAPSAPESARKKIKIPQVLQRRAPTAEEDPYAARMEFLGMVSLGIAGAVFSFAWFIPFLNILLCLAGIIFGIIAFAGGETLNGALGIAANFLLLIWSAIWTFLIFPFFLPV